MARLGNKAMVGILVAVFLCANSPARQSTIRTTAEREYSGEVYDVDFSRQWTQVIMRDKRDNHSELVVTTQSVAIQNVLQASLGLGQRVAVVYLEGNPSKLVSVSLTANPPVADHHVSEIRCKSDDTCVARVSEKGQSLEVSTSDPRCEGILITAFRESLPVDYLSHDQSKITRVKLNLP